MVWVNKSQSPLESPKISYQNFLTLSKLKLDRSGKLQGDWVDWWQIGRSTVQQRWELVMGFSYPSLDLTPLKTKISPETWCLKHIILIYCFKKWPPFARGHTYQSFVWFGRWNNGIFLRCSLSKIGSYSSIWFVHFWVKKVHQLLQGIQSQIALRIYEL